MTAVTGGNGRLLGRMALVVQLPAVLAGAAVLVVAAGAYAVPLLAMWLLGGWFTTSRTGERLVVRCLGFRRLSPAQLAVFGPVAAAALARSRMRAGSIDWYARHGAEPNAFAAGPRSVAVSSGLLAELESGRLDGDLVRAVVVHELGHHATSATRYALLAYWLSGPWRMWSRFVARVCVTVVGRRRRRSPLCMLVGAAVVSVAVAQAVHRGDWVTAAALGTSAVCLLVVPLLDAWVARRSEWLADRFAATAGVGTDLARALTVLTAEPPDRARWASRMFDRHPNRGDRLAALRAGSDLGVLHYGTECNTTVGAGRR